MEQISSLNNNLVRHFAKLMRDKKYRKEQNMLVLEGKTLLLEAMKNGIEILEVLTTKPLELNVLQYLVSDAIIAKISDTKTPQGLVFAIKMPKFDESILKSAKKVIILDGIKDPGNMGTIIRTAQGFNINAIILLNDCVDIYSPKVVRSTMGALFCVPVFKMTVMQCFDNIKLDIYATYLDKTSKNINEISLKNCGVVIGNEANGVSFDVLSRCVDKIIIPINNELESLNASVASSIIMWEMSK